MPARKKNRFSKCLYAILLLLAVLLLNGGLKAQRISADSLYNAAMDYLEADLEDIRQRDSIGIDMLEKASEMGHLEAMAELGRALIEGFYTTKNVAEGLELLFQAADQNVENAYLYLAMHYYSNEVGKSIECLKKASSLGNRLADYELYSLFRTKHSELKGIKVNIETNPQEAKFYLLRALTSGYVYAQYSAALESLSDDGLFEKDTSKAQEYFQLALNNPSLDYIPGLKDDIELEMSLID